MDPYGRGDADRSPYDEIRQRLAERDSAKRRVRMPRPSDGIQAFWRVSERTAELMENPLTLALAGCVCIGLLLVFGLAPLAGMDPPAVPPQVEMSAETLRAQLDPVGRGSQEDAFLPPLDDAVYGPPQESIEESVDDVSLESSEPALRVGENLVPETVETFVVQVGTFRSPSNAERVAMSLREQSPEVPIWVLPGRLHTVRAGPFPEMSAAVNSARAIEDAMGLTPLVIRLEAP